MYRVPLDELKKLPWVDQIPADNRTVLLHPFYDHENADWIFYIPVADGELGRISGGEPVVSAYFALEAADPQRDLHFPLGTFIAQCASFTGVIGPLHELENDFFELACILRKYELIASQFRREHLSAGLLLSSELAYLLVTIRSLYDVLQKLSKNLARTVTAIDGSGKQVMHNLPDSFAKMVLKGDVPLTSETLQAIYRLPPPIADFYAREAIRFKHLRDFREGLVHGGKSAPLNFYIESGPAVRYDESPWKEFGPWDPQHIRLNRFGSLRWLFFKIVSDAIELSTRYLDAFTSRIAVQQPLSNNKVQLYLRHPFGSFLVSLPAVLASPWEWENESQSSHTDITART